MQTYEFTANVTGLDLDVDEQMERLYTNQMVIIPADRDGLVTLQIEVDADSGELALEAFLAHMHHRVPDVLLTRIDEDLVTTKEISEILGVNRETVRLWSTSQRNADGFPTHRSVVGNQKAWPWSDVYAWAVSTGRLSADEPAPLDAKCVDFINSHLPTNPAAHEAKAASTWVVLLARHSEQRGPARLGAHWLREKSISISTPPVEYHARDGETYAYGDQKLMKVAS